VIEAWQFSLSGKSGTRSEKKSLPCGAGKQQNPPRETLGIIAHNLSKAGFSWGCMSAVDVHGRTIWIAVATMESVSLCMRMKY